MTAEHYFQVDVPTWSATQPERQGRHIFTGSADDGRQAVRLARSVCEATLAARAAGEPLPRRSPDGWGARGVRSGWELDWTAATVVPWRHNSLL
ncbi:hypothetical protein GTY54_14970 [Streptomyces sp. SID625]|nr:hypothetical protein [Streptomyces sp. SID625]